MNCVDSSGWLEYFAGGPNAASFRAPLKDRALLVVPVVTIYEVFKIVLRERGATAALDVTAAMQQGCVVDVTAKIAMEGARLSLEEGLPIADSLILAVARERSATLWTQDAHFEGLFGVKYFAKG